MGLTKITALPSRRIQIIGQIDDDNTRNFFEHLNTLENDSNKNIEVELHSEGGYAYNALAIVGRIRQSPCKIIVTGYAQVASAAVVILAAGHYRRLSKESTVQVHEDSGKIKGNVSQLEKRITRIRDAEHQWNNIMEDLTGTPAEEWAKLHTEDTYMTAEQCLYLKLVDEII